MTRDCCNHFRGFAAAFAAVQNNLRSEKKLLKKLELNKSVASSFSALLFLPSFLEVK